jgi:hypothetical protein
MNGPKVQGSSPQLEDRSHYLCEGRALLAPDLTARQDIQLFRGHLITWRIEPNTCVKEEASWRKSSPPTGESAQLFRGHLLSLRIKANTCVKEEASWRKSSPPDRTSSSSGVTSSPRG